MASATSSRQPTRYIGQAVKVRFTEPTGGSAFGVCTGVTSIGLELDVSSSHSPTGHVSPQTTEGVTRFIPWTSIAYVEVTRTEART